MKPQLLTLTAGLMLSSLGFAQPKSEDKAIHDAIVTFANAGDHQDFGAMDSILDKDFRVVMNQLFGNTGSVILDRSTYLTKLKAKELGGDKRMVTIENVVITRKNAMAQVTLKGSKFTIVTLLQLIQDHSGNWKIVSDLPSVK